MGYTADEDWKDASAMPATSNPDIVFELSQRSQKLKEIEDGFVARLTFALNAGFSVVGVDQDDDWLLTCARSNIKIKCYSSNEILLSHSENFKI